MTTRLTQPYAEVIAAALAQIPQPIRERVDQTHFVTGVDPAYMGLHFYGGNYSAWAHALHPDVHQSAIPVARRYPTIVLPQSYSEFVRSYAQPVDTVVHELGHILDFGLRWRPEVAPVTAYAQTNRWEAFAEAFEGWVTGNAPVRELAPEAYVFFGELARA